MQSQGYISRVFKELYSGGGGASKRPDLRSRDAIHGEYIKEQELQLKKISDYNIDQEEKLRCMSWYDYNFHILALKKRQDAIESQSTTLT